ncbi:efflux RND transporter periplasmic adaptor subunit [Zunongwangia sp. F363]|uniref:Efflux RND transporter periplasmic adaptor subunit n=1 Tax=Autumnicola tepida TaxID=3075595 RepID=A0ABU3CAT7_9FLAO|nr:efflux RND transporter periplasmic adaptor subunit [Zunongwangia sp. F363]MDT0643458.1 efflux RND transporter periplasmic adaptor subunit [Zunongwangia sp. F363]
MRKILMLVALCMLFCGTSCKSEKEKKEVETKFLVTSPIEKDTIITKDYVAQINSIRNIEIRAQEKGYLQKIYVDEGEKVKEGQLLFKITPSLYQAELQKAKAEADFAEIEYQNTKKLADNDVVAPNELAMAKAQYDKAKAEMALAQVHLNFTEIRAPFDGIVDRLHLKLGSLVEEGELLTTLSDNSKMWVYYNVPEAEYLNYASTGSKENTQVDLLMANNKEYDQHGVVETIEGEFNNETGNIAFRAVFDNPNELLRHGETGSILMKIPLDDALLIPQKATFEVLDKHYVFVIGEDHVVHQKEVKVGAEMPHLFAVENGLSENDKILLEGIRMVKDNEKINYEFEEPEEVLAGLDMYAE